MGSLNLIATRSFAKVEIRQGTLGVPESNELQYEGSVRKDDSFLSKEGVVQSYRRSSNPDDVNSTLDAWVHNANPTFDNVVEWELK